MQRVGVGEEENLLAAVPESGFKYFKFQNHEVGSQCLEPHHRSMNINCFIYHFKPHRSLQNPVHTHEFTHVRKFRYFPQVIKKIP